MQSTLHTVELVTIVMALLLVAAGTLALSKRIKLPFTVALVLVGIGLAQIFAQAPGWLGSFAGFSVSPETILFVFLPTLIFESAFNLDARQLRHNLLPVLTLAIPGVLVTAGLIGVLLWLVTPLDLASALLLGAILSATDPVAVVALFRQLGAPLRLTVLVEGESLFNDATSIVLTRILVGVAVGGYFFTPLGAFLDVAGFFVVFLGGALVGWLAALGFGWLLGRVRGDVSIEITLTTVLAYLSFLVAEEVFHVSGVMAVVAAGVTLGGWGRAKISPSVVGYLEHFWEYMAFVANALIFLLVGLSVNLGALYEAIDLLAWVLAAMLLSRAVVIFGLVPLVGRLPGAERIDRGYQAVMYWGGLRGAIGLALALSLGDFVHAELFVALVMGAVLFTLFVQGLTIEWLVQRLGLDKPPLEDRVARVEGLLAAMRRAWERVPELRRGGLLSERVAEGLNQRLHSGIAEQRRELEALRRRELGAEVERRLFYARLFAMEKQTYYQLFDQGHLSEQSYRELCHSIDLQGAELRHSGRLPEVTTRALWTRTLHQGLTHLAELLGGFRGWAEKLRRDRIAADYERAWGRYRVSRQILDQLENPDFAAGNLGLVEEVRNQYQRWHDTALTTIDETAAQYPEFVNLMQERLAWRLMLAAESEVIQGEVRAGSIAAGVAQEMLARLEAESHALRGRDAAALAADPAELLRKVPFFAETPESEYARVAEVLKLRTLPAGRTVIREGGRDRSLFLIARGVVRASRQGGEGGAGEEELGTLMAGDFIGEMALLNGTPRAATCRAVTPCSIYELAFRDFEAVRAVCPAIQAALEAADSERRDPA